MKNILVVGGAGYIGSHVNKMLHQAGYDTIILDNLSTGSRGNVTCGTFFEGDMANSALLDKIFQEHKIDAVMHFAAFIDVGESVKDPSKYYVNNVANTLNLLNGMVRNNVKTFIFSSTAAIFGLPSQASIEEEHPCNPINPYGTSKWMVEKILKDFDHAYGLKYCALRYFNAAGGDPDHILKNHKSKESNLIPVVLKSLKSNSSVTVFGDDYKTRDGTCIRDYIHIDDLGTAHISAMENIFNGAPSNCYNLGNGKGFTVQEVIQTVEKVTQKKVNAQIGPRRAGDSPILLADSKKAKKELNWKPQYADIETIIDHAWKALQE